MSQSQKNIRHQLVILRIALFFIVFSNYTYCMEQAIQSMLEDANFRFGFVMHQKYKNPDRLTKSLSRVALAKQGPGGLQALCHSSKGTQNVVFIACTRPYDDYEFSQNSPNEELAKSLIIPYFAPWSLANEPVCILSFHLHACSDEGEDENKVLECNAQSFFTEQSKEYTISLPFLVHAVAEKHCKKGPKKYAFGNLHFEFYDHVIDGITRLGKISLLRNKQTSLLCRSLIKTNYCFSNLFYQGMTQKDMAVLLRPQKAEWLEENLFGSIKKMTLGDFYEWAKRETHIFEELMASTNHSLFKKRVQERKEAIELLLKQLPDFFALHSKRWEKCTLGSFTITMLKTHRQPLEFVRRLQKLLSVATASATVLMDAVIIDIVSRYKHVIIVGGEVGQATVFSLLADMGFNNQLHGIIPGHDEEMVKPQVTPFKAGQVVYFLDSITKAISRNYQLLTDPRAYPNCPFSLFVEDPFLADEIRMKGVQKLDVGNTVQYVNQVTGQVSDKPFNDTNHTSCIHCSLKHPRFSSFAFFRDRSTVCSGECLLKRCLPENHPLKKLLAQDPLPSKNKKQLKLLAALIYLRYLSLAPSACTDESGFYYLRHAAIKNSLERMQKRSQEDPLVGTCSELAKAVGIDGVQLALFSELYKRLKKEYHEKLLIKARHRRFTDLPSDTSVEFDSDGRVKLYQKKQYDSLKTHWGLHDEIDPMIIPQLYLKLLNLIRSKISFKSESVESCLLFGSDGIAEKMVKQAVNRPHPRKKIAKVFPLFCIDEVDETEGSPSEHKEKFVELEGEAPVVAPIQRQSIENALFEDLVSNDVQNVSGSEAPERAVEFIDIPCMFADRVSYSIRLFNACPHLPLMHQTGKKLWQQCNGTKNAFRIRMITALAQEIESAAPLSRNTFGTYALDCQDETYDSSIREKLTLHHLFPLTVDRYLRKYGIAEIIKDSLVQLSLPGLIEYEDGSTESGFFQLSYISDGWVCIHRSFKRYTDLPSEYISQGLRELYNQFMKNGLFISRAAFI